MQSVCVRFSGVVELTFTGLEGGILENLNIILKFIGLAGASIVSLMSCNGSIQINLDQASITDEGKEMLEAAFDVKLNGPA